MNEPAFLSSSKGETVRFTIELLLHEKRMRKRFSLLFPVSQSQRFQERFRFPNRKLDTNGKQLAFNFLSSQIRLIFMF